MTRVRIERDEYYPVFDPKPVGDDEDGEDVVDLPDEVLERWASVSAAFDLIQLQIAHALDAVRPSKGPD